MKFIVKIQCLSVTNSNLKYEGVYYNRFIMVDPLGFEPREVWPSPVFKTGAFDQLSQRSTIVVKKRYKTGGATQIWTGDSSFAGCGLTTWRWHQLSFISMVPGAGLEPAQYCYRGILSPLRLPISPPGQRVSLCFITYRQWSGKRGSNSRPQPWQGCALPLSYSRNLPSYLLSRSEL